MMPSKGVSIRQWLWDPFFGYTYPGKILKSARQEVPEGELHGGFRISDVPEKNTYIALVWWLRLGTRILGLDVGLGLLIRSQESVDKILKRG